MHLMAILDHATLASVNTPFKASVEPNSVSLASLGETPEM
jgi:hypothetical protein